MEIGLSKIISFVTSLFLLASLMLVILTQGSQLFGMNCGVVLSGSMEPTIHVGSLAYYSASVNFDDLKEGQIVAFQESGNTVIHRVVDINSSSRELSTKGDANQSLDPNPVPFSNLVGVYCFSIPYLGTLVEDVSSVSSLIFSPFKG